MPQVQLLTKLDQPRWHNGERHPIHRLQSFGRKRFPHHDITKLAGQLAMVYPATARLLGVRGFDDVSYRFAARQVQRNRANAKYGAGFSNYLDDQTQARAIPYLSEVARLEWAIHLARRAPEMKSLRVDALDRFRCGKYRRVTLVLHPSCHLVRSRYPVLDLYRSIRAHAEPIEYIPPAADGARLLVQRLSTRVAFRGLADDEFRFLAAVRAGRTVNVARPHNAFDVHKEITRLAVTGAIVGCAIRTASVLQRRDRSLR